MKTSLLKNLSILILIDYISVILILLITKFIFDKVKTYYQIIQSFTDKIGSVNTILQNNVSLVNYNDFGSNLDLISNLSNKIILLFIVLFLFSFLICIISQSISWNLILNNFKLKNYKQYLKKSSLISISTILLSIYLIFNLLVKLKPFILDFWFKSLFSNEDFIIILILTLIILLILYLSIILSILVNKYKLKQSFTIIKNNFKQFSMNFIYFLLVFLTSSTLFIFIARLNKDSIWLIALSFLIFLIINNLFKLFLAKTIDKF